MALASVTYRAPIVRVASWVEPDFELLDRAIAAFEAGHFDDAFMMTLQHFSSAVGAAGPWQFVQGSAKVTLTRSGADVRCEAPLAILPEGGRAVAALRHVITKLAGSGQLHQPRLRGDTLAFEYVSRIEQLHPAKLLEVLRRMAEDADKNDDWLVGQFGAAAASQSPLRALTDAEFAAAKEIWALHWAEIDQLVDEVQKRRSVWLLNEVAVYALQRLRYTLPLAGPVLGRLTEAAEIFTDSSSDPMKRDATLAKCAKEMLALDDSQLRAGLGHAEFVIDARSEGNATTLQGFFGGQYLEDIEKYHGSGEALMAAMALIASYVSLLASYAWPDEIRAALTEGLVATSGKSWREAAGSLLPHVKKLLATTPNDTGANPDAKAEYKPAVAKDAS